MTHPKTPHLLFLLAFPNCLEFLIKNKPTNQKTSNRLCVPSIREKRRGRRRKRKTRVRGRQALRHVCVEPEEAWSEGTLGGCCKTQQPATFCPGDGEGPRQTTILTRGEGSFPLPTSPGGVKQCVCLEGLMVNCHQDFMGGGERRRKGRGKQEWGREDG